MKIKGSQKFIIASLLSIPLILSANGIGEKNQDITSLIGLIMENDSISVEENFYDYIGESYIEEDTDDFDSSIDGVLAYMGEVYSEHDFYESGGWAKVSPLALTRNSNTYRQDNYRKTSNSKQWGASGKMGTYNPKVTELPQFLTKDFHLPIKGRLTSGYGYRPKFGRVHKGIDIGLNIGDTVRNALPGVVTKVSYEEKGYGNYVIVTHSGGYETRYAHMTRSIVSPGQQLKAGQAVGLGGSTGNSTGPHLHFEIRYKGEALDPLTCFGLAKIYR